MHARGDLRGDGSRRRPLTAGSVHLREVLYNYAPPDIPDGLRLPERTREPGEVLRLKHPNRKLQDDEIIQLVSEYLAGSNIAQLGREFGMHEQTVRANLKRAQVKLRPKAAFTAEQEPEVVELYLAGSSVKQLTERYGCGPDSVRQVLHRAGVQMRPRGRPRTSG